MFYELRAKVRYMIGLWSFLRRTIDLDEARQQVKTSLAQRQSNFLRLAKRGIYANPDSPFRKLLLNAGIEFDDLQRMVGEDGLETTLSSLYERGIYITYDEMRGRAPVRRDGLEFMIRPADLDNPLLETQYEMQSNGSSGAGSRSFTDLTLLAHEAAHFALHYEAQSVGDNAAAFWGPVPPSLLGLSGCLRFAKMGRRPVRWFSPTRFPAGLPGLRARLLILYTIFVALLSGRRFPWPTYAPASEAMVIVRWLSEMRRRGTPALLQITASAATRVCLEANAQGVDISGSLFRVGGEPFTTAKAAIITGAGARAFSGYAATELGMAGLSCAAPAAALDDLHLVTDKFHVLNRDRVVDEAGLTVPALVYTTVHPNSRKIMLNAESGDCGRLEQRDCGCLIGEMGFSTHLLGLYGYDKMTSEGVTFMGSDLFKLVEEVLPARFGGGPTDYQLAEEEDANGIPYVSIVVAPGVGEVDEVLVVAVTLQALTGYDGPERGPGMAERWRQSDTLRVVRREPFSAGGRKVLPLHSQGPPASAAQPASANDER